jgi:hypothetical protein
MSLFDANQVVAKKSCCARAAAKTEIILVGK